MSKKIQLIATLSSGLVLVGLSSYFLLSNKLIGTIYKKASPKNQASPPNPPSLLTSLVDAREPSDWTHDLKKGRLLCSRMVLIGLTLRFILLLFEHPQKTALYIKNFFTAKGHPINLAMFRIGFFWFLFNSYGRGLTWYGQIPEELKIGPLGSRWLVKRMPTDERTIRYTSWLFRFFCLTGMVGLFTRLSAFLATVLGVYVIGLPHFFGKVSHNHHLLWFPAILSASRSADVFSLDALLLAWKRAEHGVTAPPNASRLYALPLRFIWLLFGVIYFFPGFWKFWDSGLDWVLSENIKYIVFKKQVKAPEWEPDFKIYKYSLLYKPGALMTLIFEMGFVFLIFLPRGPLAALIGGVTFHKMTELTLGIPFRKLRQCYIVFVDWHALFILIGRTLYQSPMIVSYNGNSKLSRRTMASLRVFDIFEQVSYVNAQTTEIVATKGKKHWHGFFAYRALAARIPILWPLLPFLYLWPIPTIAKQLYQQWAESPSVPSLATLSRKDDGEASPWDIIPQTRSGHRIEGDNSLRSIIAVSLIATLLFVVNALFGIKKITQAWPFACYPLFSQIAKPTIKTLKMLPLNSKGEPIFYGEQKLAQQMTPVRFFALGRRILKIQDDPQLLQSRLEGLWQLWIQNQPTLQEAVCVRFYEETWSTLPERKAENPLQQKLLFELDLTGTVIK